MEDPAYSDGYYHRTKVRSLLRLNERLLRHDDVRSTNGAGAGGPMVPNERIIIHPDICHGKPVIRDTRTLVSVVLGHLAAGDTFETLQQQYDIGPEDIRACIAFANEELSRLTFAPTTPAA